MRAPDNEIGVIMSIMQQYPRRARWAATVRRSVSRLVCAAACLLAASAGTVAAQAPAVGPGWLWAAQTGPDLVSMAWDSVPGATEYRIYVGDPGVPTTFTRPVLRFGRNGRYARYTGVKRAAAGIVLMALDAQGGVVQQAAFNRVVPATGFVPAAAPTGVIAQATGNEVTLTWDPVPGATAYTIGRAVAPSGLRMRCALCSTEPRFVDRDVSPGLRHTYTVAAIFPSGKVSTRVVTEALTPGATQVAAAPSGHPGAAATATTTPAPAPPPGIPAGATPTPTPAMPSGAPQLATDSVPARINPQMPATVPDTAPPTIGPMPSDAGSLATPPADTGSCVAALEAAASDTLGRIDPRSENIEGRAAPNPDATVTNDAPIAYTTTTKVGSAEYQEGKCRNRGSTGYPDLWDAVASASGLSSADKIAAWKEIAIIAIEYKHILGRLPTPDETRRDIATLKAGATWKQLWRQLAHSAERDTRYGYWAAAPIPDSIQARSDFGLAVPPWTAQTCFGGLGPRCEGIPREFNDKVQPHWFGAFRMPDNTELAYVELGVAVGSVLHDNACLKEKEGLNCNGVGAGDLVKNVQEIGGPPGSLYYSDASLEWNKAAWNVIDGRTWRARFGPYPTDPRQRNRDWYDDLRPVTPRPAMMAHAVSQFAWPGLTVTYTGGETRQSNALRAPAGTSLDATDVAFCQAASFASTGSFIGKAPWGICAEGTAPTSTPTTGPTTTGTPATGSPTTGASTPPASCKLDYQRADNMWAAAGRPDGFLGTESITLAPGEQKVFVTDWKYEKQPNDGTTYYGSHLRIATNASSRPIRLQLISGAGTVTSTVRLEPNMTNPLIQADLRAVYCEP